MSEIIVFGGVNLDQVVYLPRPPKEGETLEGQSLQTFLGLRIEETNAFLVLTMLEVLNY